MTAAQSTVSDRDAIAEQGWASLPSSYRIPNRTPTLAEAQQYCRELAQSHYENFHVASWLLPQRLRPHFYSIYAYCRISDDLGDEVPSQAQALALLDVWQEQLDACIEERPRIRPLSPCARQSAPAIFLSSHSPIC